MPRAIRPLKAHGQEKEDDPTQWSATFVDLLLNLSVVCDEPADAHKQIQGIIRKRKRLGKKTGATASGLRKVIAYFENKRDRGEDEVEGEEAPREEERQMRDEEVAQEEAEVEVTERIG